MMRALFDDETTGGVARSAVYVATRYWGERANGRRFS